MLELSPRLLAYNLGYLVLTWAIALGAIAAFWVHQRWWTFAVAFIVVSSRQQALLNCEHEAVHRKFLPSRRWNDVVGTYLCAAAVGSPFGSAQARHLSHHRLLGTPADPDHNLHDGPNKHTRRGLAKHFIGGLLGGYAGMVLMGPPDRDGAGSDSAKHDLVSLVVTQAAIGALIIVATDWWVYPALWLAPLATATAGCHLVRSFVEHAVTDDELRGPHGNRLITIESNLLERALVSPYNMNYHAEHHLAPSVPAPRLKELQDRVTAHAETPPVLVRRSYGRAIRSYLRALAD
jgi:fatty acid desaturase